MAEYIERAAILKSLGYDEKRRADVLPGSTFDIVLKEAAAEVAEVRHGRWFFKYPNGWACSRCGEWGLMIDNQGICKSSYCPNCGARMDKEDEHEAD